VIILSELSRIRSDLNFAIANTGSGTISGFASRDSLALRAKIDRLNLELFQPFLTEINNLSGMLSCEFNISGAPDNPEIIGNLDVRNLAFRHQMFMTPFEDGAVKLSFDRRNVRLDTIFLRLGEGSISMMGQMSQTQGEIDDLNIIAGLTDIRFSQPKQYAVHLKSAALRYSKQNEYYLVDGDIQFGESRLMTNLNLKSLLPWAQAVERRQPDLPPLLQKTRLDVRIRESSDLWVDNNLAHLRLHSELGIIGSPAQPNFTGMLKVEEGYLLYLDRKFNVTRGELYFIDPNRFNPEINLQARAKVTSYQGISSVQYVIILSVEGILDELTTQIYSEPPLDKPDIVALLTLGATRNQLMGKSTGNGEGGAKDIILERAGMLTSQKASGYFTNKLGTFMGLDQVSVEGNLFRFDKSWGPQLLASKRISRQLEMTYTTNVGHMNEQSIRLDYMFSKYFSLQGQTDQRGRSALDLKYRLKFK
jgi:autotransporter translocation and assembly factor TamB